MWQLQTTREYICSDRIILEYMGKHMGKRSRSNLEDNEESGE